MVYSDGKYVVRVKNAVDKFVAAEYKFYLCVRVAGIADFWASAESSHEFTLKTVLIN